MWFANLEQMSNWISLPREEQEFFENLHRNYWSRKDRDAWERLRGEGSRDQTCRVYSVSRRVNNGLETAVAARLLKR